MQRIKKTFRPTALALGLALTFGASGIARAQDADTYSVGDDAARPAQDNPAQDNPNNATQNEPGDAATQAQGPVRLARFAYIEGNVTWREDESAAWSDASMNLPVRQGAQIWVAEHGRAEIQFDDGSLLRLGSGALITLQTLYSDTEGEYTEIKLSQGLASLRTRNERSVYQVDTPYVSVKTSGASKLRVGAGESVEVAVSAGDATVEGSQGRADLHSGDYLSLDNPDAAFAIRRLPRGDSWERWNDQRDAYLEAAADRPSNRYLPPNIAIVAPDLDAYGTWREDADYGRVWCPRVVEADWRPYNAGRWTWVQPFGWTWVSSEAWGWAPYHYGTWAHRDYGWAWCPGPVTQYWSPAVVHFSEYNGGVAWCPLAPREVRYPAALSIGFRGGNWSALFSIGQAAVYYPTGNRYCEARPWNSDYINHVTRINNVTNINVTNVYNENRYVVNHNGSRNLPFTPTNAQYANGATSASLAAFGGRGPYRTMQRSEAAAFTQGRAITAPQVGQRPVAGPVSARPTAFSTSPTRTLTPGAVPSAAVENRRVFRAPQPNQYNAGNANRVYNGTTGRANGGFSRTSGGVAGTTGGAAPSPRRAYPTGGTTGTRRAADGNRTAAPTPGRGYSSGGSRSYGSGSGASGTSGAAGNSGADRARAARQSLGAGRSYGGPNGTYRQDPSVGRSGSGTSSAPRPGYTRPTDSTGSGRSESGRSGGTGRTYSQWPSTPRSEPSSRPSAPRSEPTQRTYTPPTRTYEPPVRREPSQPSHSEPTRREAPAPRQERRSEPAHSEPSRKDSGGSDKSKDSSGGAQTGHRR